MFVPRGWWFPERDTNIDLDNPFGCLESNTNVLTSVDEWDCDPMGGSWANRGLMCKVYKCTEADHEWNAKDKTWSIPGCAKNPGISTDPEDLKHRVLRWEKIPFEAPACTKEVPEGFSWQWQNDALYQDSTQFRLDDSGWLIDPKTNEYVDAHTGWYYVAAENCLMDKATGKKYTMEREEIAEPRRHSPVPGPGRSLRSARAAHVGSREGLCPPRRQALYLQPRKRLARSILRPTSTMTPTMAGHTTPPPTASSTRKRASVTR